MKEIDKILILILVIALFIRIVFIFVSPVVWWDESVYANLGHDLAKNPLDYSFANKGWSDFVADGSWPRAGFRAPLMPYFLSLFYLFNLDFLIIFLMPVVGTLMVFLTYLIGKKLFDELVGIYSALLLTFLPLHVYFSGKILADVFFAFFVLLAVFCFWKGFEEGDKKYKLLFGFFLALSLISRYNALWIFPVFLFYLLFKYKSLKFLKDKYFWYAILVFLVVLLPWFVYGYLVYGNPIGQFIHGSSAASFWGGKTPIIDFYKELVEMFSVVGVIFIISIFYIVYRREILKKEILFLLLWIIFPLIFIMFMPHKETRHIMLIVPALCILSAYFINKLRWRRILLILLVLVLIYSVVDLGLGEYKKSYTNTNLCFLKANEFLASVEGKSLVVTEQSPLTYYYSRKETHFYPNPWDFDIFNKVVNESYSGYSVYVLLSDFDFPLDGERGSRIKKDLDLNLDIVFNCENKTFVYKY